MTTAIISADPHYRHEAWAELRACVPQLKKVADLTDGAALVRWQGTWQQGAQAWQKDLPIFLRHIAPVEEMIALDDLFESDLPRLRTCVRDIVVPQLPTGARFSVQTRVLAGAHKPFDLSTPLAQLIVQESGALLDVRAPQWVVSLTIGQVEGELVAMLGFSSATENISNWVAGERRFKREEEQISRAEFKLLEAWEWFKLPQPPQGEGIDLGAAPGGWTRIMRQKAPDLPIRAVDPGELHPSLRADWGVLSIRQSAENYHKTLNPRDRFSVVLNDMRIDARQSARVMVMYAPHLHPQGWAIMTVKLPQQSGQRVLNHTLAILQPTYHIAGVRQLFHNRHEVTLYLKIAL